MARDADSTGDSGATVRGDESCALVGVLELGDDSPWADDAAAFSELGRAEAAEEERSKRNITRIDEAARSEMKERFGILIGLSPFQASPERSLLERLISIGRECGIRACEFEIHSRTA
jgi:hypothetical protein